MLPPSYLVFLWLHAQPSKPIVNWIIDKEFYFCFAWLDVCRFLSKRQEWRRAQCRSVLMCNCCSCCFYIILNILEWLLASFLPSLVWEKSWPIMVCLSTRVMVNFPCWQGCLMSFLEVWRLFHCCLIMLFLRTLGIYFTYIMIAMWNLLNHWQYLL